MKKSLLGWLIPLFLLAACTSQNQASIKGTIDNLPDGTKVFLAQRSEQGNENLDSCVAQNGAISLKFNVQQPQIFFLSIPELQFNLPIFAEAGAAMTVSDHQDDLLVEGSASQALYNDYQAQIAVLTDQQEALYQRYTQTPQENAEALQEIADQYDALEQLIDQERHNWLLQNAQSLVAPYVVMNDMYYTTDLENLALYYESMTPSVQATYYGTRLHDRIETLRVVDFGQTAPEIVLPNPQGDTMRLSDLRGQVVLIDFWASWCRPCRAENPTVVAAYDKFHQQGFTVFGVSLDSHHDRWQDAIATDNLKWETNVSDLQNFGSEVAKKYGISFIPYNFLIDRDGTIIAKGLRGPELEAKLAEVLGKAK